MPRESRVIIKHPILVKASQVISGPETAEMVRTHSFNILLACLPQPKRTQCPFSQRSLAVGNSVDIVLNLLVLALTTLANLVSMQDC